MTNFSAKRSSFLADGYLVLTIISFARALIISFLAAEVKTPLFNAAVVY